MDQLQLVIPWEEFRNQLSGFIDAAQAMRHTELKTVGDITEFNTKAFAWDEAVLKCLAESFNHQQNNYVDEFLELHGSNFNVPWHTLDVDGQIKQAKGKITEKSSYLSFNIKFLSACDAIVRPGTVELVKMRALTVKQKQQLLLEKLHELYDDNYYPIAELLSGNGIVLRKSNEADQIAEGLANTGLIDLQRFLGTETRAQLTVEGVNYLEESQAAETENYENIPNSYAEMSAKLDEIKAQLSKLGMGHEILFDELQELKELYKTLNKKNWGQLLKGKLIDLALAKLIDTDTLKLIYEAIAHHPFKLLS